ncbi:MAG: FixH family protein [Pseudomonadota bacterium]
MTRQQEDTLPWYRQFWPWFIIALPASAVIAGLSTVWIAMQGTDSLVFQSDDGINVVTERHLAAERTASETGLGAMLSINAATRAVTVSLTSTANTPTPDTLRLELLHPTQHGHDLETALVRAMPNAAGEPTWAGHFVQQPSGRYYVVLSSGDDWRLSSEWSGEASKALGRTADARE